MPETNKFKKCFKPAKTVGIIGGGQLALMMIESHPKVNFVVLDPNPKCPASYVAEQIVANYGDVNALEQLAKTSDVVTYELENIPVGSVKKIENLVKPNLKTLKICQHRWREKLLAKKLGVPVPKFFLIKDLATLKKALTKTNGRGVLKTCEGGYDGKGQVVLRNNTVTEKAQEMVKNFSCILEELILFSSEAAVVGCRDELGNFTHLPTTTKHSEGILVQGLNWCDPKVEAQMVSWVRRIMAHLEIVGTLCMEFFVTSSKIIFNEMAPRPHNSAHWSIEAATVSQFYNHVEVIMGKKVSYTKCKMPAGIVNLLGNQITFAKKNLTFNWELLLHDYRKESIRAKRKMGHLTVLNKCRNLLEKEVNHITQLINQNA